MSTRFGLQIFCAFAIALSLIGNALSGCSWSGVKPQSIQFRLTPPDRTYSAHSGRGPNLADMQFFALVVSGDSTLTSTTLGSRKPSCLYLDGQVLSPLTYEQLTVKGVDVNVSTGANRFRIVGFYGGQGATIGEIFSSPDAPPQTYLIADSGVINLASKSQLALPAIYTTATKNRSAFCPSSTLVKLPATLYRGMSGNGFASVQAYAAEGAIPPLSFNTGEPMTVISSLIGSFFLNPFIADEEGLHPRVDIALNESAYVGSGSYWEMVLYAKLKTGQTGRVNGINCGDFISTDPAAAKFYLFRGSTTSWMSPDVSTFDDGVIVSKWDQNGLISSIPVANKFLFSIRSDVFAGNGKCSRMDIESVDITIRDPY